MPDISASKPVAGAPIETAWGAQVHDAIEGIQHGVAAVTLGGSNPFTGQTAVVFPRAFASYPVTVVCSPDTGNTAKVQCQATSINLTGCTIIGWRDGGSAGAVVNMRYIAIGVVAP